MRVGSTWVIHIFCIKYRSALLPQWDLQRVQAYDTGDSGFFALPEGLGTESSDTHFLHHASVHGATAVGSLTCAGL